MGDGVGADVHTSSDLVVVQSLGNQPGDGSLGAGQALPSGDGLGGGRGPVAAADAEFAQPPPDAGLVAVGVDLQVTAECLLQVVDRLFPVALAAMQFAEVFCRRCPGPRVGVPRGGFGQAGWVAAGKAPAVCSGDG